MNHVRWIPVLFFPLIAASALGAGKEFLRSENQLLEAELALAAAPRIYVVFDLKEKKVALKARGRVLKQLEVQGVRSWGRVPAVRVVTLVEKTALFPPKRSVIRPNSSGNNKEDEPSPLETPEFKDMPASFTLVTDGETRITVRPAPTGMISWLWGLHYPIRWYLTRPVLTLWHALRKEPFTSLEIVLEGNEARTLYWSFLEGMTAIVYSPARP